jgi:hypothetical protein
MRYICSVCSYETSRKWSYDDHISRPNACDKRKKRNSHKVQDTIVNVEDKIVNVIVNVEDNNNSEGHNVVNKCIKCGKILSCKKSLNKHLKSCNDVDSLQCFTCKKKFSTRQGKYQHLKNVKCTPVIIEDEKDIKIKDLEKQLEEEKAKPKNLTINNNNFNANITYNAYTNLTTDHITWQDTAAMYNRNEGDLPKTFFDVGTQIHDVPENQCIALLEGPKYNYCILKEGRNESRYPLHMILPKLIKGTATKIESDLKIAQYKDAIIENTNDEYKLAKDLDTLYQLSLMDSPDGEMTKKDIEFFKKLINTYSNTVKHVLLCASKEHL